jgi:hypothetical protein
MIRDVADRDVGSVSLYLKGSKLEPDVITSLLGIEPTKSRHSGPLENEASVDAKYATGLWVRSIDFQSVSAVPFLQELLETLIHSGVDLSTLPGVEEAFIDLFIARECVEDGRLDVFLSFPNQVFELLTRTKLSFQLTFAGIPRAAFQTGVPVG